MLNLLRFRGFSGEFLSALSGEMFHIVGYAFVDDTNLIQSTRSEIDTIDDVREQM